MKKIIIALFVILASMFSNAYSVDDVAKTLYHEARGEGEIGIRAVASVIVNRATKRYGKATIRQCSYEVRRKLQFSCWNGKKDLRVGKGHAWEVCVKVAKEMEAGTFKATHRHTHYYAYNWVMPPWDCDMGIIIGNHKFLTPTPRKG